MAGITDGQLTFIIPFVKLPSAADYAADRGRYGKPRCSINNAVVAAEMRGAAEEHDNRGVVLGGYKKKDINPNPRGGAYIATYNTYNNAFCPGGRPGGFHAFLFKSGGKKLRLNYSSGCAKNASLQIISCVLLTPEKLPSSDIPDFCIKSFDRVVG